MKRLILTVIMMLFLSSPALAELCFVQSVMEDGSLKLLNGERARLIGLNIPQDKTQEAYQFIKGLVSGMVVSLELDAEERDIDGYLQGYVWFKFEENVREIVSVIPEDYETRYILDEDGEWTGVVLVMLNATMIKSGLAVPESTPPNVKYDDLHHEIYQDRLAKLAGISADLPKETAALNK